MATILEETIINLNAVPEPPYSEWKIKEHVLLPEEEFDLKKLVAISKLTEDHRGCISGNEYVKLFHEDKTILLANENILDFLVRHPEHIPENAKGKTMYFFGTRYHIEGKEHSNRSWKLWYPAGGNPSLHKKDSCWMDYNGLCCPPESLVIVYRL